jgi:hypothetical protein
MQKAVLLCVGLAVAVAQTSCTMVYCTGDGPLKREELGDWLGLAPKPAPEPQELQRRVAELKAVESGTFAGRFSMWGDSPVFDLNCGFLFEVPFTPAPGFVVKGRINRWALLWPGGQHGDWLFFDRVHKSVREFYISEDQWDFLVVGTDRADAYDVATRERVAAHATVDIPGLALGWMRVRNIAPVDRIGQTGLQALASPKTAFDKVGYEVRDTSIVLFGIFGWGRVNHGYYVQFLWIPFRVGTVRAPA